MPIYVQNILYFAGVAMSGLSFLTLHRQGQARPSVQSFFVMTFWLGLTVTAIAQLPKLGLFSQ